MKSAHAARSLAYTYFRAGEGGHDRGRTMPPPFLASLAEDPAVKVARRWNNQSVEASKSFGVPLLIV